MPIKSIDEKILTELFLDSKQSYRQLSKKLNISKENLSKKVKHFEDENIIKNFSVGINYDKLGFIEYNLFLRLKKLNEKFYEELIYYLKNHMNTTWIGKSFGKYDLKVAIIIKDHFELNNFISELSENFPNKIELFESLFVIDKYKSSKELFISNLFPNLDLKNNFKKYIEKNIDKNINLELIDKQIIYEISKNSKISLVDLGHKLNILPETLKYKISKLEKHNYLKNYSIVFDGNKLNNIWCVVLFNISPIEIENFKKYLKQNSNISSFVQTQGVWNLSVTFFSKDIISLYENLNILRNKFSKEILNFEYLIYFDFYKFPNAPKCILN